MNTALAIILGLGLALALSFALSGMEAGLPLANRIRIRHLCRQKSTSARILQGFLDRPEEFLWTILVGNTVATFSVLCASLFLLHAWLGRSLVLVFGLLALEVFLLYAVADLLPKMLFRKYPNRLCHALARPVRIIHMALRPAVAPVAWLARTVLRLTGGEHFTDRLRGNRDELRSLMQESSTVLTSEERTMVNRVLQVQNRTVGSLMTPLGKVLTVPEDLPAGEFLRVCRETGRQRLPVRGQSATTLLGVVSVRTTLYRSDLDPARPIREYMEEPYHLDQTVGVEEALKRFQRSGRRLAIVVGQDRREVGLITLGDILRFLFGEAPL